jgi:hypothetical protein
MIIQGYHKTEKLAKKRRIYTVFQMDDLERCDAFVRVVKRQAVSVIAWIEVGLDYSIASIEILFES